MNARTHIWNTRLIGKPLIPFMVDVALDKEIDCDWRDLFQNQDFLDGCRQKIDDNPKRLSNLGDLPNYPNDASSLTSPYLAFLRGYMHWVAGSMHVSANEMNSLENEFLSAVYIGISKMCFGKHPDSVEYPSEDNRRSFSCYDPERGSLEHFFFDTMTLNLRKVFKDILLRHRKMESLDAPLHDGDDATLGDIMVTTVDPDVELNERQVISHELFETCIPIALRKLHEADPLFHEIMMKCVVQDPPENPNSLSKIMKIPRSSIYTKLKAAETMFQSIMVDTVSKHMNIDPGKVKDLIDWSAT